MERQCRYCWWGLTMHWPSKSINQAVVCWSRYLLCLKLMLSISYSFICLNLFLINLPCIRQLMLILVSLLERNGWWIIWTRYGEILLLILNGDESQNSLDLSHSKKQCQSLSISSWHRRHQGPTVIARRVRLRQFGKKWKQPCQRRCLILFGTFRLHIFFCHIVKPKEDFAKPSAPKEMASLYPFLTKYSPFSL